MSAARDAIARLNPHVAVVPYALRLTAENVTGLVADYDVVVDGCDNFASRFAVACAAARWCPPPCSPSTAR